MEIISVIKNADQRKEGRKERGGIRLIIGMSYEKYVGEDLSYKYKEILY